MSRNRADLDCAIVLHELTVTASVYVADICKTETVFIPYRFRLTVYSPARSELPSAALPSESRNDAFQTGFSVPSVPFSANTEICGTAARSITMHASRMGNTFFFKKFIVRHNNPRHLILNSKNSMPSSHYCLAAIIRIVAAFALALRQRRRILL